MLNNIADFERAHEDATRMLLIRCIAEIKKHNRCIAEIKKHNSISPQTLEDFAGNERKMVQSIQVAMSVTSSESVLQILEFKLSQLPPARVGRRNNNVNNINDNITDHKYYSYILNQT